MEEYFRLCYSKPGNIKTYYYLFEGQGFKGKHVAKLEVLAFG